MKIKKWIYQILMHPFARWTLARARKSILTSEEFGEKKEIELLLLLVKKIRTLPNLARPYVFFDIGSNVGIYTNIFKNMGFDIFAVEANKSLAFKLKSEYIFDRVSVLNAVVGAESESVMFYENINHGISSVMRPRSDELKDAYELKNIKLDDFSYLSPMVMKIDIEGCEDRAIQGASKILEFIKPVCLLEAEMVDIKYFVDLFFAYGYKPLAYFFKNKSFEFVTIEEARDNMDRNDSPIRTNILFMPAWVGEVKYSELIQ